MLAKKTFHGQQKRLLHLHLQKVKINIYIYGDGSKPITIFWEFLGYPGSQGFDAEPFRKIRLQQTLKFGMQEDTQHYIVYKRRTTMNS